MATNSNSRGNKPAEQENGGKQAVSGKSGSSSASERNNMPSKNEDTAPVRKPGSQSNSSKQGNNGRGGGK